MKSNAFAMALAAGVSACSMAGGYPENPVNTDVDVAPLKYYFGDKVIADFRAKPSQDFRNEIIFGRVAAYDAEFAQFQIDINSERSLTGAGGDIAVAALGGVGTALSAQATKNALLAATTAVNGAKGAINKDIFYDQAMGSIFSYMSSNRKTIYANIVEGSAKSLRDYPLTQGIADTLAYRDAGSVPAALAAIAERTGPAKKDAQDALAKANARVYQMSLLRQGLYFDRKTQQLLPVPKNPPQ